MRKFTIIISIAILAIISSSCEKSNKKLIVGYWQAVEFVTEDSTFQPYPLGEDKFTIKFERNNDLIGNSTVTNNVGGHYSLNEHTISIHAQNLTDVGELNVYVDPFFNALNNANSYDLYNDTLVLYYNYGNELILLRRK